MEHLMRHSGSPLTNGATAQSSFAPAGNSATGEHVFGRPRWTRPKRKGNAPAAFGQYATSHAVLAGGCPAIGDPAVAPIGRVRRRAG
jgi:hypothetical protein